MHSLRSSIFVLLTLAWSIGCDPTTIENPAGAESPEGWAKVREQTIALELAISPAEQTLGLGKRASLPWGHGMLFLYETPRFHRFWMKDMQFDIDIVWIRDNRIVEISHHVRHRPGTTGDQVSSQELTDRVLELPAGYASAQGLRKGNRVEIEILRDDWPPN